MPNGISRETFKGMDTDAKLNVLYDIGADHNAVLRRLEKKMDRRYKYDLTVAGFMGFIGGFIAHWIEWLKR